MSTLTIEVTSLDDIFDMRDHARIPRKRLDPDWLTYVFERMENHPHSARLKLTLHVSPQLLERHDSSILANNIREQLKQHYTTLGRALRENFRLGKLTLFYSLVTLAIFTGLSEAAHIFASGSLGEALHQGFLIFGWVALWRPVETLLYAWIPISQERKKIKQLIDGEIAVVPEHRHHRD